MKQALLSILLLAVTFVVQAQTKLVYEETLPESYLVKYENAGNQSQTNINSIITLLSKADEKKGGGRPGRTPEFVVRFEQQARIVDAGDKLQLLVQLTKFSTSSDIMYRGFDIAKVLQPEKLNVKIRLLNEQNKEVKAYDLQSIVLDKDKVVVLETTVPDSTEGHTYKLRIAPKELIFTEKNVQQVQAYIEQVQAYYAAEITVNTALKDVLRIAPEDIEHLAQHDRRLKDLEDLHAKLQNAAFREKLNIKQQDPHELLIKMNRLDHLLQDRRRALNHTLATLDQQFYNRAVDMALAGNVKGAQNYLAKSLEVNPKFAPAHLQMAKLDFRNGYIHEAAARTHQMLTGMRVDPETRQQALVLAHDIYSTYITQGNNHTSRGDYNHALAAYGEARTLCSTIGGLQCNLPALNDGEARAAYGAYRAMVGEGTRFLAQNNLVKAEQMVDEALHFQKQYNFALHGATEATDLQNQVKYQLYVQHIDQGKRSLNERNYTAALNQFEVALDMEQAYGFQRVNELGTLAQKAAKPVILQELQLGYDVARNNKLPEARNVASKVMAMQSRFGLTQDTDIRSSYNLLKDRISTQECINVQNAYDGHFQKAKELAQSKSYLAADKAYQAAIDVATGNGACSVATFTAQDGREAIAHAVTYQRMLADINRFVASSRYTEAIEYYMAAEKHYLTNQVNRFGLDHISLYNYAKDNKKQPFTASVAKYMADLGEEKIALDLLTDLLNKGYAKRKTKSIQEQLGKQLALKDEQLGVTADPKAQAGVYVNCNRKLNKLGDAYVKERKN